MTPAFTDSIGHARKNHALRERVTLLSLFNVYRKHLVIFMLVRVICSSSHNQTIKLINKKIMG